MNEQVIVEIQDDTTIEKLSSLLPMHMKVESYQNNVAVVTVFEARDAEQEVSNTLNKLLISAFVAAK